MMNGDNLISIVQVFGTTVSSPSYYPQILVFLTVNERMFEKVGNNQLAFLNTLSMFT